MKRNVNLARLGLLIVAIIWGSGFVASALALQMFTTNQILALRFTIAFVISLIIFWKDLKSITKENIKYGLIIGIFLFLAFMFQTLGLEHTTASKNAFLTAINIVIVPFLSYFILKEKIKKQEILGSVIALIGIALISFDGNAIGNLNKGDILTLVCAAFFALQIFYTDHYVKNTKPGIIMIGQMGMAALLSWIYVAISKDFLFDVSMKKLYPVLYLGIVSTMVAYGIQTWSQKMVDSTESAIILSTEAFFGMLASIVLLGEEVSSYLYIAGILIFTGILIVQIKPKSKES